MNYALILAGGAGTRLGGDTPKQFLDLAGKPVIAWSMKAFDDADDISGIVVACPEAYRESVWETGEANGIGKLVAVVAGGETRQLSAYNALTAIDYSDDDIVLIHDAARPFVTAAVIRDCVVAAEAFGAASAYVKVTDTVAEAWDGFVAAIPDRSSLYNTQTPQAFRYGIIRRSHERARAEGAVNSSDDVRLIMDAGTRVRVVEGDYRNIKITNPRDMEIAERIALSWEGPR
ncbi:MAG: 2-C-methyl-D-erythritol 4-phosphate cytidylyltransferase [Spirochaetes bacterium]|nr:2-C-methyl-D-erythritol 4-phosphate cytidylyltransferase [Spirochaetota bacterium]HPA71204.1 2-C-methyl-D-erythritol 4-phosphate cytidylyltransferase [Spirochaetota bacterium]